MIKKLNKILFFCLALMFSSLTAYSQGMNWQFSSRMPSSSPVFFIGATAEFNYYSHTADFVIYEDIYNASTMPFTNGLGRGFSAGIHGEYWYDAQYAYSCDITYYSIPGKFSSDVEQLPVVQGGTMDYRVESETTLSYLNIEPGIKYRLFESNFHVGFNMQFKFFMDSTQKQTEKALNYENESRGMEDARLPEIRSLLIMPKIRAGYDFSIGLGRYATIYTGIGIPLMNITKEQVWRDWTFSAGIAFNFGLF